MEKKRYVGSGHHRWRSSPQAVITAGGLYRRRSSPLAVFTAGGHHRWRFSPFWGWGVMSVYQRIPAYTTRIPRVYHAYTTQIPRVYHAYTARIPRVYQKSLAYTTRIPRVYHAYTSAYQRIPAYTSVYRAYTSVYRAYTIYIYVNTKATVMMLHLFWLDRRLGHVVAIHMLGL